jgi:hypothetical protein
MNPRARRAALTILLLKEEFSPTELAEAVSLISGHEGEDLLAYLSRAGSGPHGPSPPHSKGGGLNARGETRALQEVKQADAEKYVVLRDFETLIREGRVLRTLDDFRAFGIVLGKDFTPGKSRKDALGRLMAVLAKMDLESIRSAIAKAPSRSGEEENAFRRLANQIISGPRNHTTDNSPHP